MISFWPETGEVGPDERDRFIEFALMVLRRRLVRRGGGS